MRTISDAVVIKDGEPFFLCPPEVRIWRSGGHGYGQYQHDCRFLGGHELEIAPARGAALPPISQPEVAARAIAYGAEPRTGYDAQQTRSLRVATGPTISGGRWRATTAREGASRAGPRGGPPQFRMTTRRPAIATMLATRGLAALAALGGGR